jgi:alpha-D-ribose 1-methylphosphonate 5-triphosphate synthase subunit PhnH
MNEILTAGFADPVAGAQQCFRAVLEAMARPGCSIGTVGGVVPPAPLCIASAAVLLTLTDHETSLWLDPAALGARHWIAFHCGAPEAVGPGSAAFALSLGLPDLATFATGTHEGPETSATIVVQLPSLTGGKPLRLRGPGIKTTTLLAPVGLSADFTAIWRRNRGLFPAGIDLILCAGADLAALPRTVQVEEA